MTPARARVKEMAEQARQKDETMRQSLDSLNAGLYGRAQRAPERWAPERSKVYRPLNGSGKDDD